MDRAVRVCVDDRIPLGDALRMASATPAALLGIGECRASRPAPPRPRRPRRDAGVGTMVGRALGAPRRDPRAAMVARAERSGAAPAPQARNDPRTPSAGPATAPDSKQRADLVLGVAELAQQLLGVLAERGARPLRRVAGRARQLHRHAELAHRLGDARLVDLDDHLARAHVRGVEHLVEVEHGLEAAVVLGGERGPLGARARGDDLLDRAVRRRAGRVELPGDRGPRARRRGRTRPRTSARARRS